MPTATPKRRTSWFSNALSAFNRLFRPTAVEASPAPPKLEPIEDIVSRAGREHAETK